jgi:hypothetical protein
MPKTNTKEVKKCVGRSELWVNWFSCPKRGCDYDLILSHANFCAKCGQALTWPEDIQALPGYKKYGVSDEHT